MERQHRAGSSPLTSTANNAFTATPGKQTLTAALPAIQAKPQATGALKADAGASVDPTAAPSGGGAPLPDDVRKKMEQAMGADFSAVRIHEGPEAAAVGARAFTRGSDIFFAPGEYQPQSPAGQELLGHELAHVVQQGQGRVQAPAQAKGGAINADAGLEHEADAIGAKAARGEHAGDAGGAPAASGGAAIQRKIGEPTNVIFGLAGRNAGQIQTAVEAGYHTFDAADTYAGTLDLLAAAINKAIADHGKARGDFEVIYKVDSTPPEALAVHLTGVAAKLGGYIDHVLVHKSSDKVQAQKYQPVLNQLKAETKIRHVGGGDVSHDMADELAGHDSFEIDANALLVAADREKLIAELKKSAKPVFVYNIPATAKKLLGLGPDDRPTTPQISAMVERIRTVVPTAAPILSSGSTDTIKANKDIDHDDEDYTEGSATMQKFAAYQEIEKGPRPDVAVVAMDKMPDDVKQKVSDLVGAQGDDGTPKYKWDAGLLFPKEEDNGKALALEIAKFTPQQLAIHYGTADKHHTLGQLIHMLFEINNCHRVEAVNEFQGMYG